MKRKTAKEILAESFREMAEIKPVDRIAVIEIVENCGYSTTTFYRHFRDKYDLMAWEYTRHIEELMRRLDADGYEWKRLCLDAVRLFDGQKDDLKNLLLHTSGMDSFARNMKSIHFEALKKRVLKVSNATALDVKMEMYVRGYCQGTVDLTCDWIMGQYDASCEELAEVYENFPSVPLRNCLVDR